MPDPTPAGSDWPLRCSRHRNSLAISLCTRCGAFLCRDCRGLDDSGLALCPGCDPGRTASPVGHREHGDQGFVAHAIQTARLAILKPGILAETISSRGDLAQAVKFGVLAIVIGKLFFLFWILVLQQEAYFEVLKPLAQQLDMTVKTYQILQIAILPLDALARLALFGLLLRLGVRLAAGPNQVPYRDFVRIFAYASAGYLLLALPLFLGVVVSLGYVVVICHRAVKHRFALTGHQAVIALTPMVLALLFLELMGGF